MRKHIDCLLSSCNQTLFALRTLRAHGLTNASLQAIFMAVAVGKLRYAAPAWYGFTNAEDRERLEVFLRKSKRAGYCAPSMPPFSSLCGDADATLFAAMRAGKCHVLHQLLPPRPQESTTFAHAPMTLLFPSDNPVYQTKTF